MERIINEVTEKLKSEFNIFFLGKQTDIEAAESFFGSRIAEAVLHLLQAYYEQQDQQLLEDKAGRKQAGLSVERHGVKREVLTLFGRWDTAGHTTRKPAGVTNTLLTSLPASKHTNESARAWRCRW